MGKGLPPCILYVFMSIYTGSFIASYGTRLRQGMASTYVYMGLSVSCRNFPTLQLPYNVVSSPSLTQPLLVVTNISGRGGGSFSIRHTNRQDR